MGEAPQRSYWGRPGRSLLSIAAAGVLLLAGAGLYLFFTYQHSVGTGPAGPIPPGAMFARTCSSRSVVLLGLGDSVTAGFGARKGYSYFDRLVANPPDDFEEMKGISLSAVFPQLTSTNLAVSGSTSSELAGLQVPRIPQAASNLFGLVVITTGGNDLIHNYGRTPPQPQAMYGATWGQAEPWIRTFQQRLEKIVTEVSARFPGGCQIFLANIYDPSDGVGDIEKAGLPPWRDGGKILAAYNNVIRDCAERHENVHLVNMHDLFLGHGIHCGQFWSKHYDRKDPHYWYYTNLEDPNERGYDAIRRLFLIEIAKVANSFRHPDESAL